MRLGGQGTRGYFKGEALAAEKIVEQVAVNCEVEIQVGIADGVFAALLAARGRGGGRSREPPIRRRHPWYLLSELAEATKLRLHLVVLYAQITMRTPPAPEIPEGFPATEWTSEDVLRYLAIRGRNIAPATWYSYVSRGQAPQPIRRVGRTPVFDPLQIIAFADASTGPGRPRSE